MEKLYDLIYANADGRKAMGKSFPQASFEDASDFIHEERFSILVNMPTEEYYLKLLDVGIALCSLNFQLWMHENTEECKELIKKWKSAK